VDKDRSGLCQDDRKLFGEEVLIDDELELAVAKIDLRHRRALVAGHR